MQKLLYFLMLFVCAQSNKIYAQTKTLPNSFTIEGNYDKNKQAFYESSILNASMEKYRLKDKDVVLKFKEGFECVFLSAKSLFLQGRTIDVNLYQTEFPLQYQLPIFSIDANGHLLGEVMPVGKYLVK